MTALTEWVALKPWIKAEIEVARDKLEQAADPHASAVLRGRILALRELLDHAEPAIIPPIEPAAPISLTAGPRNY